jgi:hypothetical protein
MKLVSKSSTGLDLSSNLKVWQSKKTNSKLQVHPGVWDIVSVAKSKGGPAFLVESET